MSITMTTVILFAVFGVLLFLGVPISISIVASSIVTAMSTLSWDQITFITMQKMNSGVESFSLLAVPLFILAGNIMNNGGIAKRLVNFAQLFVGKIPGSMAQANILGNMLFGALSGSSVAAASAMGGCISPIEEENGYDPAYSAAANIASAPTGLLIPPTSAFIVYSTVAGGVSISTLFMAGYIPGILMGLCCMIVAFIGAKKAGMKATGIDHSQSINWRKRTIHVQRGVVKLSHQESITKDPKTSSGDRMVYLSKEMCQLLKAWRKECEWDRQQTANEKVSEDDYLFRQPNGKPMCPSTFTYRFKLILKANNLPLDLNVHSLRHTNASLLISQGVDVRTVASLLGHAQASTTLDIYAHAFDKNKRKAQEKLGKAIGL